MEYGIVIRPVVTLYEVPAETKSEEGVTLSAIADEALYGTGLAVTGAEVNGFLPVRTFYGYAGYVHREEIRPVNLDELRAWENGGLMVTTPFSVDVVSVPKVQGVKLVSLYRGSLVRRIPHECSTEGWDKVKLPDGRSGYLRTQYLGVKAFSQEGLWTGTLPQKEIVDKAAFRRAVAETAKTYLGIQYRWGGRSTAGIDCSGLTSVSYMLNGILTYRDAKIEEGYPVHEIAVDKMEMGDLLYFPGHIAMYIGEGKYIHSTGKAGSGGVVINSLNPEDEEFRADLAESLYAVGSIF